MKHNVIFWDVDTQFDFMSPKGALYVPGADKIVETVSRARQFALDNSFSIIADVDWHSKSNPEISDHPDFRTTFPPHCMAGQPGSERVGYLGDVPIDYVDVAQMNGRNLARLAAKDPFHLVIRKQTLNVFDNPNTDVLIDLVQPKQAVVFGVALDFCVSYVLRGLAAHEGIKLYLLRDATAGLGSKPDEEVYEELTRIGVEVTTLDACEGLLECGALTAQRRY
jgi:nicotinamidase/pyrazinamidase